LPYPPASYTQGSGGREEGTGRPGDTDAHHADYTHNEGVGGASGASRLGLHNVRPTHERSECTGVERSSPHTRAERAGLVLHNVHTTVERSETSGAAQRAAEHSVNERELQL